MGEPRLLASSPGLFANPSSGILMHRSVIRPWAWRDGCMDGWMHGQICLGHYSRDSRGIPHAVEYDRDGHPITSNPLPPLPSAVKSLASCVQSSRAPGLSWTTPVAFNAVERQCSRGVPSMRHRPAVERDSTRCLHESRRGSTFAVDRMAEGVTTPSPRPSPPSIPPSIRRRPEKVAGCHGGASEGDRVPAPESWVPPVPGRHASREFHRCARGGGRPFESGLGSSLLVTCLPTHAAASPPPAQPSPPWGPRARVPLASAAADWLGFGGRSVVRREGDSVGVGLHRRVSCRA